MTTLPAPPRAFSGSRLAWADLPRPVRRRIAELAGAEVVSEASATSGFSPGYASVLELADGTDVFVKAVSPEQNAGSPALARAEIEVAGALPAGVRAPELLWHDDDGTWVVSGFDAIEGRPPEVPWTPQELTRVLAAVADLAEAGTPSPSGLPHVGERLAGVLGGWDRLADDGAAIDRAVALVGVHGPWLREHLDTLHEWAATAPDAVTGRTLLHNDLRADNVMLGNDDTVWFIDWPHAARDGARWFDLLAMLPSVAMQGGGDPAEIFWSHPNARDADRDAVRAALAAVAGFFVEAAVRPAPLGLSNLRPFQAAQGIAALEWLARW